MLSMAFVHVLNAKVIHIEDKHDGPPAVLPEAWCDSALVIAMFTKAFG